MGKACVDCKWHFFGDLGVPLHSCTHPAARQFDPVYGGMFPNAEKERAAKGNCGPDGIRWQPKLLVRLRNWLTEAA